MIIIKNLSDLEKYLNVNKNKCVFEFYEAEKLADVLFACDFSLDSLSLHSKEKNLGKIASSEVRIKANTIKAYNLSCDYITAKKILCKNLQLTYSLECEDVKARDIESLNIKAKNIDCNNISSSYIECKNLKCNVANFYSIIAEKIVAENISGEKIECENIICDKIKLN